MKQVIKSEECVFFEQSSWCGARGHLKLDCTFMNKLYWSKEFYSLSSIVPDIE